MSDLIEEEILEETQRNQNKFKISPTKAVIVTFLIMVCLQVISGVVNIPAELFNKKLYHFTLPISFALGGSLAIYVLIPFVKTDIRTVLDSVFKPVGILIVALSILFYFFMLPATELTTSLIPTQGNKYIELLYKMFINNFEMMLDYPISGFIMVCILAPVFEEILFRGILLRGLLQNGTAPWIAILFSSFLFGAAHLNPWQFLGAGILGAIFGYVYYRTKSLWLVMLLHALNNTISYLLMFKYGSLEVDVTNTTDYKMIVASLVIATAIGLIIHKLTKDKIKWT